MQAIIIAPNQEDRDYLSFVLRRSGLAVASSADLQRVTATLVERPVDLIVVSDASYPELPSRIEQARTVTQAPILVVTDPISEDGHCTLLDAGADLVMIRPVSPRILARYAWIFLRRAAHAPAFSLPVLELDEIVLDPTSRTVLVLNREPQHLTQLEFRLLYVLITNRGQIIPSEAIVEHVWGYTGEGSRELVRGLIRRLRRKIEPDPNKPQFIQNVPGIGYRFTIE